MPKNKELSSLIHRRYDSEAAFARDLGWTRQRLNKLTTGVKEPDISEAALMAEKLEVSVDSLVTIFLAQISPNGQLV